VTAPGPGPDDGGPDFGGPDFGGQDFDGPDDSGPDDGGPDGEWVGIGVGDLEPDRLTATADAIEYPDSDAGHAAKLRQLERPGRAGSLGRLEDLGIWAASVQGRCPPADFVRARLVVFAGDHGIAAADVSGTPHDATVGRVRRLLDGTAAAALLSAGSGVGLRVADLSLAAPVPVEPEVARQISRFKVRSSSGRIDVADALSLAQLRAAVAAGCAIADEEIDAGADLLLCGDVGMANSTPAAVLVSVLAGAEPVKVTGRGSGVSDSGWIRKCAAIRDARRRAMPFQDDPTRLLATASGADIAAMTAFILQAAARRTPVVLDGLVPCAAALAAHRANPRVVRWLQAAHAGTEPGQRIALERMGLHPLLDFAIRHGEGTGAVLAVPLLRAATRLFGERANAPGGRSADV
jgi:nicotinate-nucleotide--dimethylbenzimidazole phosphoribosyltransferase